MQEELITDAVLREFLLGKLAGEQRERIENLFLIDSQTRERVLVIEQDLIEDYLEDSLTRADKERFLSIYAQTDEQRRKLKITKSIKDWAVTAARAPQAPAATSSVWSQLRTQLRLKPVFAVPIALAVVVAIVLAIVWLNSTIEQRKHLAVEQELAQLNSPTSLREVPPDMMSKELRPVRVRSVEPQIEVNPPANIRIVELRLPWIQKERYSTYQAEVRRLDSDKSFTIRNLRSETDGGYRIRIRLLSHILSRGQYQIELRGNVNDGFASAAEEYQLTVGR